MWRLQVASCASIVLAMLVAASPTGAAEKKACTRELPAALQALGTEAAAGSVLSVPQASRERGSGRPIFSQGVFVRFDATLFLNGANVVFSGVAGGESVRLTFDSRGFHFSTRGAAVLVTAP